MSSFFVQPSSNNSPYRKVSSGDYILILAQTVIYQRNISTFGNFLTPISLEPCNLTDSHGDRLYDLKPHRKHFFRVHLKLLEGSHVLIRTGQTWVVLAKYLDIYSSTKWTGSGDYFCSSQFSKSEMRASLQKFWAANGKSFRLLGLPAELRNNVYRFAMGSQAFPYRYKTNPVHTKYFDIEEGPSTSLLRVNKQVRREARSILFNETRFCFFDNFSPLCFSLDVAPIDVTALRHLELSFTHVGFLNFFGADLASHMKLGEQEATLLLRKLELYSICLRFPHPSELRRCRWLRSGCQKTICSWILEAAKPYIQHIYNIKLEGSVKAKQKQDFFAELERHRRGDPGFGEETVQTSQAELRTL
ncbi:MAG: hypothetical protein M1830_002165 [Pleopsidium flavum]|nr:MAG: hypothetical protein M1830_002165 [Pleopsidium flavum]